MDWGHWNPPAGVNEMPSGCIGFLYKITDKSNNKFYVGIKQVSKKIRRKPLKGKTRARISTGESDWRNYCSSSGEISESIEANEAGYIFDILGLYNTKTDLKYAEASYLIKNDCLMNKNCYNLMFNYRLNFKHIKNKK